MKRRRGEPLAWWEVIDRARRWDQAAREGCPPGTWRWAITLKNRLVIWLLVLTGARGIELIQLRLTGPHPHVLRGADGTIAALVFPRPSVRRPYRIFPLDGFDRLRTLLDIYIQRARPLLLRGGLDASGRLIVGQFGHSYTITHFTITYRSLREQILGPRSRLTLYDTRRVAFLVLYLGLGRSFGEVRRLVGWDPAWTLKNTTRMEALGASAFSLLTPAPPTVEAERIVEDLRRWLGDTTEELSALDDVCAAPSAMGEEASP